MMTAHLFSTGARGGGGAQIRRSGSMRGEAARVATAAPPPLRAKVRAGNFGARVVVSAPQRPRLWPSRRVACSLRVKTWAEQRAGPTPDPGQFLLAPSNAQGEVGGPKVKLGI